MPKAIRRALAKRAFNRAVNELAAYSRLPYDRWIPSVQTDLLLRAERLGREYARHA